MEQTERSEPIPLPPALTLSPVVAEALKSIRSIIVAFIPLASFFVVAITAFFYFVGIHTYDIYRDFGGISIHTIEPNINDIMIRGAEAGLLGGFVLLGGFLAIFTSIFFFTSFFSVRHASRIDKFYKELIANPELVKSGSKRDRETKKAIQKRIKQGWSPDNQNIISTIAIFSLSTSCLLSIPLTIPIGFLSGKLIGYGYFGSEGSIPYLISGTLPENFIYYTDRGSFCGNILVEGQKGIAIGISDGSTIILHHNDITRIVRISSCGQHQSRHN